MEQFIDMRTKSITEQPFYGIVNREWKRSKRLLPMLRQRTRPTFKWADSGHLGGAYGRCYRSANVIYVHHQFKFLKDHKEFCLLIRHEIAHMLKPSDGVSHGKDFTFWNNRLGGSRFVKSTLTEMRKKQDI